MSTAAVDEARPDTRARILIEAERLFRHYGYSKTTVADIARELGMSSANVYRFFPSKLAINEAICQQILDDRIVVLMAIARQDGPVLGRIREFIRVNHQMTMDVLLDERKVHEMVAVAMEENWDAIRLHLEKQVEILARLLAEGMAAGEVRTGDPVTMAKCLKMGFASLIHPLLAVKCAEDTGGAEAAQLIDFLVHALKA